MLARRRPRGSSIAHAVAVVAALVAVIAVAGFSWLRWQRNSVRFVEHLAPEHPAFSRLQPAASDGERALRAALADYMLERPAPDLLRPVQMRYRGDAPPRFRRLEDALPQSVRDWRPGQKLPWSGGIPQADLFALQRQIFLFDVDWGAAEPGAIEAALAFLAEWRRGNPDWPNRNPFAWNDDATSNRISAQMYVMERARAAGRSDRETELAFLPSLLQHARHLVSEEEHNFRTNHGMMQNSALLALALHYPELDRDREWQRLAIERMRTHLAQSVTEDGVFLELTSDYHWWATLNTMWFVGACRQAGVDLDPAFETALRGLLVFAREILYPDKTLPLIADTRPNKTPRVPTWLWEAVPPWPEREALQRAFAEEGCPNEPGARLWPRAGYFLLRAPAPDWTPASALMLTFKLHSESLAHEHRDALTLTLFARGAPLIVGPGYPGYDDRDARRELTGTGSQNTVAVDGVSQRIGRSTVTVDDVRLEDGVPRFAAVGAKHALYDGVTHERVVYFGVAGSALLVVDRLASTTEHRYALQFRPAPDLDPDLAPGVALLSRPGEAAPRLAIRSWLIGEDGLVRPAATRDGAMIRFTHEGREAHFATVLDAGGDDDAGSLTLEDGALLWRGEPWGQVLTFDVSGRGEPSREILPANVESQDLTP